MDCYAAKTTNSVFTQSRMLVMGCAIWAGGMAGSTFGVEAGEASMSTPGKTYYVRQTIGDDNNDGLSPQTAWRHIAKLGSVLRAGDTAYVGPGLYREQILVAHDGTADQPIRFIGEPTGEPTGDPPGAVMIAGAEPVEEGIFTPHASNGVYKVEFAGYRVIGVVEMDGAQSRYLRVGQTKEHLVDKMSEVDVVAKKPSSYTYDDETKMLYIHTSDGKSPASHELEFMRRLHGISMTGKRHIVITGFTFRNQGDAGINFFEGTSDCVASNNTSYGSRQGIRVYCATNIVVSGNTLFRNENSGVYFAKASINSLVVSNTAYENTKGIRWSSGSVDGRAVGNTLFDNLERGVSIENTDNTTVMGNRLVNNQVSQLLIIQSDYHSNRNCFQNGNAAQLITEFYYSERFKCLGQYQQAKKQDLQSTEGSCGALPVKADVHRLHRETMTYGERAARQLKTAAQDDSSATKTETNAEQNKPPEVTNPSQP